MSKYFRYHRGSFAESLATMRKVSGLADMKQLILAELPNVKNIHISKTHYNDIRMPHQWDGKTHYVLADFDGYESQCIGMCNFYEE